MQRCQTWKESKRELQAYRPRKPEASALYRLVYHGRDELVRVWEDRFQPRYGVLRKEVLSTFDEYLNCGLLCHGAARVYCDGCKRSFLVAFSCKKRGVCPSCSAKSDFAKATSGHRPTIEEDLAKAKATAGEQYSLPSTYMTKCLRRCQTGT